MKSPVLQVPRSISRREFLTGFAAAGTAAAGSAMLRRQAFASTLADRLAKARSSQFSTPIQNVILVIRENHSYDNILGNYEQGDGIPQGANVPACENSIGQDPWHNHSNAIAALEENGVTAPQANCAYTEDLIPGYYQLARNYVICDQMYAEVMGPTVPNHLALLGARPTTATNPSNAWICPYICLDVPTLPDRLDATGMSWKLYGGSYWDTLTLIERMHDRPELVDETDFDTDVAAGALPNLCFLQSANYSEHPPNKECQNANWMMDRVSMLMNSPQWSSSVMIILWDDWGGFYDHVRPPNVETYKPYGDQFRYGYRIPCVIISPYAKQGYVSHTLYSSSSVPALIEALFNLESLSDLDAHANNMLDCFDFSHLRTDLPLPDDAVCPRN